MLRSTLLATFLITPQVLAAQNWDRYQAGSLTTIIADHQGTATEHGGPGTPHWGLSGEDFPTKARLIYTGEHRPLSPERRELLAKWQKTFGVNPAVLDVFQNEWRFREDTVDIWIAVQRQLEEPLAKEGTPGKPLSALTTFIGSHYAGGPVSWLFLLNEFEASE